MNPSPLPDAPACVTVLHTAPTPGAIAIIEIVGAVEPVLGRVTRRADWPAGRPALADLGGVDEGIVVRLAPDVAQLMPHGGPRVVQRIVELLERAGAPRCHEAAVDPCRLFPEAADRVEALMLAALARAASPLAVELLLAQPARWRGHPRFDRDDAERSRRLDRLLHPPDVVLVGPANVGKSRLTNRLFGRRVSIDYDRAGTTRDYTRGLVDLGGLVVRWHDTPGLHDAAGPIERRAIALAQRLIAAADYVVAMTDAAHDWPVLARPADLRVGGRADLGPRVDADVNVSAADGTGIAALVSRVRDALVPPKDLAHPGPWRFDPRIEATTRLR